MNSSGLIARVALLITRLLLGMNDMPIMPMMIMDSSTLGSRWVAMLITRIASSSDGTARNQSTIRIMTWSILPPR